ncbi:MAG: M3 family metallopeptidase [Wenzhouxiangella sp.]
MSENTIDNNPLLAAGLPRFDAIKPEHAEPALNHRLSDYRALIDQLTEADAAPGFAELVEGEALADAELSDCWSTISHLHSVCNTPAWREVYGRCLEHLTAFHTERGQNRRLYEAYRQLAGREDFSEQTADLQATVRHELQAFELSGVALDGEARERFARISLRLSALGNQFGNHVLDATEGFEVVFDNDRALAGLPEDELALLAEMARQKDREGWLANLSYPAYRAIVTYADDRALRERFYRANISRASDTGPQAGRFDNTPVVAEMLKLRQEQAELLGFDHHAAVKLSTRMADTTEQVEHFLQDLAQRARPQAVTELETLSQFAANQGAALPLAPWDIAYYSEKLRQATLGLSEETLKPYFELERCFDALFTVAADLFGLSFQRDDQAPGWHETVRYYRVCDRQGRAFAGLYLDLYARTGKSGGAWMGVCRSRLKLGRTQPSHQQQPIAYLTCNFAPPAPNRPSLLAHDDVVTLFHEFGHCLHHLLTRIDLPAVGGISGVEWDAVELPSQLMEGWAWEAEALNRYARHVETGQALPSTLLDAMQADRCFQGGLMLLRQVEFALCDLRLHARPGAEPLAVMAEVNRDVGLMPLIEDNRYLMSFSHLFDGGYSAGYYSYLWAEQLARDAFDLFREQGLFNPAAGEQLANEILAVGASRPMSESWQAFRGRPARLEPLLQSYGIAVS